MKNLLLITCVIMLALTFICCKKETVKQEIPIAQKIQGKWKISKNYYVEHLNNNPKNYVILYREGDYWEFRNDNKLYTRELGRNDTTNYVIDGSKITFSKELFHSLSANVSESPEFGISLLFISNDGTDYNSNTIYLVK